MQHFQQTQHGEEAQQLWRYSATSRICFLSCPFVIVVVMLALLNTSLALAASGRVLYVAPAGNCGEASPCFATIQAAVDAAHSGDDVRIASGVYTGVNSIGGLTQTVYLAKSLTFRGGYAISDWENPAPHQATILDARRAGRVLFVGSNISVTLENLQLIHGDARGMGGVPRFQGSSAGGGLYAISSTLQISNTTLRENFADTGAGGYVEASSLFLYNSTLLSNTGSIGGGLFLESGNSVLKDNSMTANQGDGGGVAVYFGNADLSGNHIEGNQSSAHGGGILFVDSNGALNQNVIVGNKGQTGGGASLDGNITLIQNTIAKNEGEWGAGIALETGQFIVRQNTIRDNQASFLGGGVAIDISTNAPDPDLKVLSNNIISGNVAPVGGGIWCQFVQPVLSHNQFLGNHATQQGGGLYLTESRIHMDGDIFIGNSANQQGGAIFMYQYSDSSFANLVLMKNQAGGEGSALWIEASRLDLAQATIVDNPGHSAIYDSFFQDQAIEGKQVTITNSIVASQTVGVGGSEQVGVSVDGVLWSGNGANTAGPAAIQVTNEVTGAPAFAADGYHLTSVSAALDQAANTTVGNDVDGEPRCAGQIDLGADEFWRAQNFTRLYLPRVDQSPNQP